MPRYQPCNRSLVFLSRRSGLENVSHLNGEQQRTQELRLSKRARLIMTGVSTGVSTGVKVGACSLRSPAPQRCLCITDVSGWNILVHTIGCIVTRATGRRQGLDIMTPQQDPKSLSRFDRCTAGAQMQGRWNDENARGYVLHVYAKRSHGIGRENKR